MTLARNNLPKMRPSRRKIFVMLECATLAATLDSLTLFLYGARNDPSIRDLACIRAHTRIYMYTRRVWVKRERIANPPRDAFHCARARSSVHSPRKSMEKRETEENSGRRIGLRLVIVVLIPEMNEEPLKHELSLSAFSSLRCLSPSVFLSGRRTRGRRARPLLPFTLLYRKLE